MYNEIIICEPSNSNLFPFIGVRHVGKDFFDVKDISPMFESTQVITFRLVQIFQVTSYHLTIFNLF